ncbi:MAG: R3H domain-containing nucleic acid-binding protein [Candidatus Nanopelagicales bacterium]
MDHEPSESAGPGHAESGSEAIGDDAVAQSGGADSEGEPEAAAGPHPTTAGPARPAVGPGVAESDDSTELVDEGEVAADYLEGLLDIADLDGDIDISVENDRPAVAVIEVNEGDLAHLVGDRGKVLTALQDLTRLAVARETGHRSRLMLDIAGHRATRRAELTRQAQDAITEARDSAQPVRMPAMSAFERKVVHDAVAAAGLASESEGTDPNRYVVITPA